MHSGLASSRIVDAGEAETAFGRALLQVRYRALQRQIPLLYMIALANALGFNLGTGLSVGTLAHPVNVLLLLVALRLFYWLRNRNRELPPEAILIELRKTLFLAAVDASAQGRARSVRVARRAVRRRTYRGARPVRFAAGAELPRRPGLWAVAAARRRRRAGARRREARSLLRRARRIPRRPRRLIPPVSTGSFDVQPG
jgi:hypothetical protein